MTLEEEESRNSNDMDDEKFQTTADGDRDADSEAIDDFFQASNYRNNITISANDVTASNSNIDDNVKAHAWPLTYGFVIIFITPTIQYFLFECKCLLLYGL